MVQRPGCFSGLLKIFLFDWLFNWLQKNFGFGRGCSCSGIGCGCILLVIFIAIVCSILTGTDWSSLRF
jgi:hypothetical protein